MKPPNWTVGSLTRVIRMYEETLAPERETELFGPYIEDIFWGSPDESVPVDAKRAERWLEKYAALKCPTKLNQNLHRRQTTSTFKMRHPVLAYSGSIAHIFLRHPSACTHAA